MYISTSNCPSCGQLIRKQTNPAKEIGMPFERCRYCGKTYINSYKEEWITKSPVRRFFFFLQIYVWARAFMVPMLILSIPIIAFDWDSDIVFAVWPFLSLAWLIGGYFIHKKAEQDDIVASIERTRDPKYVKVLKRYGYSIYPIRNNPIIVDTQPKENSDSYKEKSLYSDVCHCRKCGQTLVTDSLYCHKCGERL